MANDFDSAVGAVLEIPTEALQKISQAEQRIKRLGAVSEAIAEDVRKDWAITAVSGLQTFIEKIRSTEQELGKIGKDGINFNINTTVAQQNLDNLSNQTKKTTNDVSANLQKIATEHVSFAQVRDEVESTGKTFGEVKQQIKAFKQGLEGLKVGEGDNTRLAIKAWEDYYKSITKTTAEADRHKQVIAELNSRISQIKGQIDQENIATNRLTDRINRAWEAVNAFKNANPDFNVQKAEQQLESLRAKIQRLYDQLEGGVSEKKENRITREIEQLKHQFTELDQKLLTSRQVYSNLANAEDDYLQKQQQKEKVLVEQISILNYLEKELQKAYQAQEAFNRELDKGHTAQSLAKEYKDLTKRLQEVNQAMTDFRSKGGDIKSPSYQALEQEYLNILSRRKDIEKMDIAEVNQYRQQMTQQAYQADLSAFVQNEAQKRAEAQKTLDEQIQKAKLAGQQYAQSYAGAMTQFSKLMDDNNTSSKFVMNLENVKRILNDLKTASGKLNLLDPNDAQKAERIKKAIEQLTKILNRYKEVASDKVEPTFASAQQAVATAKATKSLQDYKNAYEQLKAVMATMDSSTVQFKKMSKDAQEMKTKIDQIKRSMGEFQSQTKRTGDLMDNLKGKIAAAFSIAAISGFIKKVVETRAQFELQRIALGAIIQDTDKANKTFLQIQQMALQSPFSIMQLERATKQIAAFGFEADKLLPTMKMLGDISAGLGVEIDRLILVMGHLKARNYLEGTMVRQFTNAGFNVLGELAKYYSELEGKMVSVAEVQTRVKKKMVEFGDVEEVLKRVTAAGGMFYDMQKKQSDSLWGQMQRITDAYDLMLNEIGKDNQSVISQALTAVRSLIQHWRILAPTIKAVGYTMAAVFAARGIGALLIGLTKFHTLLVRIPILLKTITTGIRTMNLAWTTTGVGALVAGVSILASMIAGAYAEAKALNGEINHIQEEGETKMFSLIYKYRELADAVSSSTKSYAEKEEALKELKRTYGDILPAEMLQIDNIKKMTDGYKGATDAIREYMNEQMRVNAREAVDKETRTAYSEWQNRLAKRFAEGLIDWNNIDTNESEMKGRIKAITDQIYQEIMNGNLKAENGLRRFRELLQQYYGLEDLPKVTNAFASMWESKWWDIAQVGKDSFQNIFEDYSDFMDEVESRFDESLTLAQRVQMQKAKPQRDQYAKLTKVMEEYAKKVRDVKASDIINTPANKVTAQQQQSLKDLQKQIKEVNNLRDKLGLMPITYAEIRKSLESNMEVEKHLREESLKTYRAQLDSIEAFARASNNDALLGWVDNMRKKINATDLSDVQKEIQKIIDDVEDLNNINLGDFRWAIIDSSTTVSEARTNVKKELDALKESIKEYEASTAKSILGPIAAKLFFQGKTIEQVREDVDALELLWQRLGGHEKEKKSGKDPILEQWKNRLDALKRYYDAAEKARKHLDEGETRASQAESFEKLWSDLGLNKLKGLSLNELLEQGFDPKKLQTDYVGAMKQLLEYVPKKYEELRTKIQEQSIEIKFKIKEDEEENLKHQIEEMINTYELGKEFTGLGLPVELTMMLGKEPIKSPEELRELLQKGFEAAGGDKAAENVVKAYKDAFNKVDDIIFKNQKEQIKNYNKYLIESMGERVQIELKAMQDINKIREDANLDAFSKEQAIMQRRNKLTEDLAKFDFDKLKASDIYINTFKDLESASKQSLQYVIDKLEELKSVNENLSVSQVRALNNEIKKAQEALMGQTALPDFGNNLKYAINYAKQRGRLILDQIELQKQLDDKKAELDGEQKVLYRLIEKRDVLKENSEEWEKANQEVIKQQMVISFLENEVKRLGGEVEGVNNKISQGELAWKGVQSAIANVRTKMKEAKEAMDSVFAGLDSMGLVNDAFRDTYESISDIMGGLDTFISSLESMDITKPFTIITGAVKSIGGIFQTIGGFFGIGDKKKEREIKRLQKSIEDLDKAYQKLEKSIENAFTFDQYNAGYNQAKKNLEQQKRYYNEMIRLEESKKKKDEEQIKQYKDALEEIAKAEEELRKERIDAMGSTSEYLSEAQSFVDAWLDAYREVGDGLDSLNESWDEFIDNLAVKQAASAVVSQQMKRVIDKINAAIDQNKTGLDLADAVKQATDEWKKSAPAIQDGLKEFFNAMGVSLGKGGEFVLSDLQKGIQNITEPQAAAIEAYLNSIRFEVFRRGEQIDALLATIQAQYGAGESPMLQEVRLIRSVVESINEQLSRVIVNKNANSNYVLKVG